ncbi:MAG TPA: hypothetical protein VHD14_03865 [Pseudolabrys sp.]|jgi:hypothetical protein|nr:hypothetical protein [Pseudolabrys sp.]
MSISVGATHALHHHSHAHAAQDPKSAEGKSKVTDPLSALLQATSDSADDTDETDGPTAPVASTGQSKFSPDTLGSMISMQSQQSNDPSAANGTPADQFAQLLTKGAQALLPAAGSLLALI